jgi:hypothetical protein
MVKSSVYFTRRFEWRAGCKTQVHDTQRWRTLTKQKNHIKTRLRELPLDKLGEMLAELKSETGG